MRRIGAHLSIAGGLDKAVESIVDKDGNCLQIFSGSPRGWQMKLPSKEEAKKFIDLCKANDVKPIFIHAKYLINLGSEKKGLVAISKKSLIHDLRVAEIIKAKGVIVHSGSHLGRGFAAVKEQLIETITEILKDEADMKHELVIALLRAKMGVKDVERMFLVEVAFDYGKEGNKSNWTST